MTYTGKQLNSTLIDACVNYMNNAGKYIDSTGTYHAYKDIDGKPRVSSMPYLYDIAEGNVTNHTAFTKLGYNGDVGATEEDIWTQGGIYSFPPAGGIPMEVVSSQAVDNLTGTGVQKVKITYLDETYTQQTEVLSLNGVTAVPTVAQKILRVNSIRATQVGTGKVAAGDITLKAVGSATVYRAISTGFTRGRGLIYTVPLGKTLYITSISLSSGFTTAGKIVRWIGRAEVDDTAPTVKIDFYQPFFELMTQDASFHRCFEIPVKIPATASLKISATSNGAGSFCSCSLRGWSE